MKTSNIKTAKQEETLSTLLKMNTTKVKIDKTTSVLENTELINSAKTDFSMKKELLHQLTSEVNYKLKGDAWADIKRIVKMFTHIGKSMKEYGMDIPQLRHYGFNEGTIHHIEYQKQKMSAKERKDMPWKYMDKNPNSLFKQLAMCEYYYAHIDTSDLSISIAKEHLMELVSMASSYE
jgi:hypothetical protein